MSGFSFKEKIIAVVDNIKKDKNLSSGLVFVFSCAFLIAVFFTFLYYIPEVVKESLIFFTMKGVVFLSNLIGLSARIVPESELWMFGNFVSINGFIFNVLFGCVALNYLVIFIAGIITYPSPLRERLYGLLICVPLVILINFIRIIFIGWFGSKYPAHVEFVHQVFWEWTFFFAVVAVWWMWITYGALILKGLPGVKLKPTALSLNLEIRIIALLALLVGIFLGHSLLTKIYMYCLAVFSSLLMTLLGLGSGIVEAEDAGINILGWVTSVPSVMEICLFVGFTICFSSLSDKRLFFMKLFTGIAFVVFLHLAVIFITYWDLRDLVANPMITDRFNAVLPLTPFFIWLFLNASDIINKRISGKSGMSVIKDDIST